MKIILDIPDEKINKYGNDTLKIRLAFVDRKVIQTNGYTFYQLPKDHNDLSDNKILNKDVMKDVNEAYKQGRNDAWECAKKLFTAKSRKEWNEIADRFDVIPIEIYKVFNKYSAEEAIEKIKGR